MNKMPAIKHFQQNVETALKTTQVLIANSKDPNLFPSSSTPANLAGWQKCM
jgi:hypothetical protein